MYRFIVPLLLSVVAQHINAQPAYMTTCKKSDPEFKNCLILNAKNTVAKLIEGDSALKLRTIKPLVIEKIDLQMTPKLKTKLTDCVIHGLEDIEFKEITMTDEELTVEALIPKMVIDVNYDVKGQLMMIPLEGNGHAMMNATKVDVKYMTKLESATRKGKEYYKIVESHVDVKPTDVVFNLENLFNGDQELGKQINKILNDQWKEVFDEVHDAIDGTLSAILTQYVQPYFRKYPKTDFIE